MYYDRKIKYLDYYERGERVRGGGHAKLEVRDGRLRMELAVAGMHVTDSFVREVFLCTEERENMVGKINIAEGKGNYSQQWNQPGNIGGTGISYEELCGIRIPLGSGREISCRWPAQVRTAVRKEISRSVEVRAAESEGKVAFKREERNVAGSCDKSGNGFAAEAETNVTEIPDHRGTDRGDRDKEETEGVWDKEQKGNYGIGVRKTEVKNKEGKDGFGIGVSETEVKNKEGKSGGVSETEVKNEEGKDGFGIGVRETEVKNKDSKDGFEEGGTNRRGRPDGERKVAYDREQAGTVEPGSAEGRIDREQMVRDGGQKALKQERRPVKLLENKWSQLWEIYPHIRPFNDEREYISIGPSDFVLFPEGSYKMVNNSFLLHGFYSYKHLLLARVERRGEAMYYVGVPGTFFEKEKQVAIMFGFESFECAEEPAQAGDFGYYMMRTGL